MITDLDGDDCVHNRSDDQEDEDDDDAEDGEAMDLAISSLKTISYLDEREKIPSLPKKTASSFFYIISFIPFLSFFFLPPRWG